MTQYCLDACSIINLFCGWGGIQELHSFGTSWSTTTTALGEFKDVRAQQPDGTIVRMPLNQDLLLEQYPLTVYAEFHPREVATATDLSALIDDGEAECLAIAKHRELIFVSDDGPAILAAEGLGVRTASSLDLIIAWSELEASHPARLAEIVERIEILARYVPPRSHSRKEWWDRLRCPH